MKSLVGRIRRQLEAYGGLPALVRALPPILLVAALWWLSSLPGVDAPAPFIETLFHNSQHVVAYFALGGLIFLALPRGDGARRFSVSVALASVYGVIDEWHQSHVPGRDASLADMASDALGATIAAASLLGLLHGSRRSLAALPWLGLCACASVCAASLS